MNLDENEVLNPCRARICDQGSMLEKATNAFSSVTNKIQLSRKIASCSLFSVVRPEFRLPNLLNFDPALVFECSIGALSNLFLFKRINKKNISKIATDPYWQSI